MSGELVSRWNFTGKWHDDRIEQWLERQAAQGLHLESSKEFGRYVFRRGTPARVTYRIDVAPGPRIDIDYLQLLTDAGWRMAAQRGDLYFWRHEGQEAPELFTDIPSRVLKYRRLLRTAMLIVALAAFCLSKAGINWLLGEPVSRFDKFAAPLWLVLAVYGGYSYLCLRTRIRALRECAAL